MYSIKKLYLKIPQYSQQSNCVGLFLIMLQAYSPSTLLKRDSNTNLFREYCEETFKNTFFEEHLQTAASVFRNYSIQKHSHKKLKET